MHGKNARISILHSVTSTKHDLQFHFKIALAYKTFTPYNISKQKGKKIKIDGSKYRSSITSTPIRFRHLAFAPNKDQNRDVPYGLVSLETIEIESPMSHCSYRTLLEYLSLDRLRNGADVLINDFRSHRDALFDYARRLNSTRWGSSSGVKKFLER
jgi:hypothetical protein